MSSFGMAEPCEWKDHIWNSFTGKTAPSWKVSFGMELAILEEQSFPSSAGCLALFALRSEPLKMVQWACRRIMMACGVFNYMMTYCFSHRPSALFSVQGCPALGWIRVVQWRKLLFVRIPASFVAEIGRCVANSAWECENRTLVSWLRQLNVVLENSSSALCQRVSMWC